MLCDQIGDYVSMSCDHMPCDQKPWDRLYTIYACCNEFRMRTKSTKFSTIRGVTGEKHPTFIGKQSVLDE